MKIASEEAIAVEKANKEYFEEAEAVNVFSTDKMFRDEFESEEEDESATVSEVEAMSEEYIRYVDTKFDYTAATKELMLFAAERGCKLDANTVREILASVSSSRMLVFNGMSDDDFELIMKVLCEYFGTELHIDKLDSTYTDEGSVLFEGKQTDKKRSAMLAIEAARAERHKIHMIGYSDVKASDFVGCLASFVKYAKSPTGHNSITVGAGSNANTYYIPKNLWIVLNLSADETVAHVTELALEASTLNNVKMARCDVSEVATEVHKFYYYQLDYLVEKNASKCEISENEWKKLDSFVELINKDVYFAIGNKQWVGMERYISIYTVSGGEIDVAFDSAIAVRLIPSIAATAYTAEKRTDLMEALNVAFGEGEAPICHSVIRRISQNKAKSED